MRANVGAGWEPLALFEVPPRESEEPPPPALDVSEPPDPTLQLSVLDEELTQLFVNSWQQRGWPGVHKKLVALTEKWSNVPGAKRLLAAALRTIGSHLAARHLVPERPPFLRPEPQLLRTRYLTGAEEPPDEMVGLSGTQRTLLNVVGQCAPETGPLVPRAALLDEARLAFPNLDEARIVDELVLMGHPSLHRLPLLALQGCSGGFEPRASFTHARLTSVGREVCLRGAEVMCGARPTFEFQVSSLATRRTRLVVRKFPWPLLVAEVRDQLERATREGHLDGVASVVDESSADEQRLTIELEHLVFAVPVRHVLSSRGSSTSSIRSPCGSPRQGARRRWTPSTCSGPSSRRERRSR